MATIKRCMGIKTKSLISDQAMACLSCQRLPEDGQENAKEWIDAPNVNPCPCRIPK